MLDMIVRFHCKGCNDNKYLKIRSLNMHIKYMKWSLNPQTKVYLNSLCNVILEKSTGFKRLLNQNQ